MFMMVAVLSLYHVFVTGIIHAFCPLYAEHLHLMRRDMFLVCTTHFLKFYQLKLAWTLIIPEMGVHIVHQKRNIT